MKKKKFLSFILVLCLCMQSVIVSSHATEYTEETETLPLGSVDMNAPMVDTDGIEGIVSTNYGCRTINGMTPLSGSDRILETTQAAFVFDANNQTVIYSYNPDAQLMPGSLSKIMAALIAIENMDLDTVITCSTRWNNSLPLQSMVAKIKEGEELTLRDLLFCMIVASANDAALNIANNVAPNEAAFVEMMNQRAAQIGCTNTHFTNCHGLDREDQYSSARDIAKITLEAYKNPIFREIFATTSYKIAPTNRNEKEKVLETSNHLMYEKILPQFYDVRVKGGMPSYAAKSGAGLSCIAEDKGMSLVIVVMGGTRTYNDSGNAKYYGNFEEVVDLLQYSFGKFRVCRLLYPGQILQNFPVVGGNDSVYGEVDIAIDTVLPADVHLKNLIFRYQLKDDNLSAPINKGDLLGTVQIWYRTSCIIEADVYAGNPVHLDTNSGLEIHGAARDDNNAKDILKFLAIACAVIIIPFMLFVGINLLRRAIWKARRRRRRKGRRRIR